MNKRLKVMPTATHFKSFLYASSSKPRTICEPRITMGLRNQIGFLGHQLDRFRARRRMFLHVSRAEDFVARIQKFPAIALADQRVQFGLGQTLRAQVARFKFHTQFQQETPCFAAGSSGWLVEKLDS